MPRRNSLKRRSTKTTLRLPDLEQSKNAVLHSLAAASSQESYGHAIDEFIGWYCSEPRLAFNGGCHQGWRDLPASQSAGEDLGRWNHAQGDLAHRESGREAWRHQKPCSP